MQPPIDANAIPAELRTIDQWVNWRYIPRPGQRKPAKPPIDAKTGEICDHTNPSSWASFDVALGRYRNNPVALAGVGFMLTPQLGVVGIDLDDCVVRGNVASWASKIIAELDTYAEVSPSQTGVRLWCYGSLPPTGRKRGNVEMYCDGRFLTVTGQHITGTPNTLEQRTGAIMALHSRLFPQAPPKSTVQPTQPVMLDDAKLLEKMFSSKRGRELWQLWNHLETSNPSRGDILVCSALAFWTGKDAARMRQLFMQSGRVRDKCGRRARAIDENYLAGTVRIAIENCSKVYEPRGA